MAAVREITCWNGYIVGILLVLSRISTRWGKLNLYSDYYLSRYIVKLYRGIKASAKFVFGLPYDMSR
jgi:hypothetical protein